MTPCEKAHKGRDAGWRFSLLLNQNGLFSGTPARVESINIKRPTKRSIPGKDHIYIYTHPPPPPIFWPEGILRGRVEGVNSEPPPCGRIFVGPPLFPTLPTPKRVFSGVGGWGCIEFRPSSMRERRTGKRNSCTSIREEKTRFFLNHAFA